MSLGLLASLIKIRILSYPDFFLLVIYLKLGFIFIFLLFVHVYVCVSSFMSDVLRIISGCQLCPSIACFSFFNHHRSTNTFTTGTLCVTQSH